MTGYTKLFQTLVTSSIWSEEDKTRIVWITMLSLVNKDGMVEASLPGLAAVSRVSLEDCQKAIDKLLAPDTYSRSTEHEGRRIERVEGGWTILNHAKYRNKMNSDERREYNRKKVAEHRAKLKEKGALVYATQKPTRAAAAAAIETGIMPGSEVMP